MRPCPAALALLLAGCSSEVTVGENRSAVPSQGGDSGLLAVRFDAAKGSSVAAGHHGCAEPTSVDCDAWLAEVDAAAEITSRDGFASGLLDTATSLWLLDADSVIVAGIASTSGQPRALALRFDAERLVWDEQALSLAAESAAYAVELAPDDTLVVAGNELAGGGLFDGFVTRIDADGNVLDRSSLFGTGAQDTEIDCLVVTELNHAFVGGARRGAQGSLQPVVVQLGQELEVNNSNAGLDLDVAGGRTTGLLADGDSGFLACGSADDQAFVARIDLQLNLLDSVFLAEPSASIEVRGCAATDDDGIVLVGALDGEPWVGKVDRATLDPIFTRSPGPSSASLWAVTGTVAGRALAVGRNEPAGRPFAIEILP